MNLFQIFLVLFFGAAFVGFIYSLIEAFRLGLQVRRLERRERLPLKADSLTN